MFTLSLEGPPLLRSQEFIYQLWAPGITQEKRQQAPALQIVGVDILRILIYTRCRNPERPDQAARNSAEFHCE